MTKSIFIGDQKIFFIQYDKDLKNFNHQFLSNLTIINSLICNITRHKITFWINRISVRTQFYGEHNSVRHIRKVYDLLKYMIRINIYK